MCVCVPTVTVWEGAVYPPPPPLERDVGFQGPGGAGLTPGTCRGGGGSGRVGPPPLLASRIAGGWVPFLAATLVCPPVPPPHPLPSPVLPSLGGGGFRLGLYFEISRLSFLRCFLEMHPESLLVM